jgi:rhamnose utilization protein RhaD (predicted bifunctional aldolase and dehydrogenase)
MSIEALVEISRYYGGNPDYVLAGGGNTSWKDDNTLYVKASGFLLAEAAADSFVTLDRKVLALIWEKTYPESGEEREKAVLADLLAASKQGEEQNRPSVETLLHDIIPFAFVVHLHPALVNGLTCSQQGEQAVREIFGNDAVWIPSANPGYTLAVQVKNEVDAYYIKHHKPASIIFLQNHGVFVGADSVDGIKTTYGEIMSKIGARIKKQFSNEDPIMKIAKTLEEIAGASVILVDGHIAALVKDRASFAPVSSAFTPDHIVYAGSNPLFIEINSGVSDAALQEAALKKAWKDHVERTGRNPKIVAIQGMGVFGVAPTEKAALLALDLFRDAVKIAFYSESFGGPLFMAQDKIDFINNWEAERFRSNVSIK